MKYMFLKSDLEKAENEMDCYLYCTNLAAESAMNGEFEKALAYNDNAVRSLNELQELKEDKEEFEEVAELLKRLEKPFRLDLSIVWGTNDEP